MSVVIEFVFAPASDCWRRL